MNVNSNTVVVIVLLMKNDNTIIVLIIGINFIIIFSCEVLIWKLCFLRICFKVSYKLQHRFWRWRLGLSVLENHIFIRSFIFKLTKICLSVRYFSGTCWLFCHFMHIAWEVIMCTEQKTEQKKIMRSNLISAICMHFHTARFPSCRGAGE